MNPLQPHMAMGGTVPGWGQQCEPLELGFGGLRRGWASRGGWVDLMIFGGFIYIYNIIILFLGMISWQTRRHFQALSSAASELLAAKWDGGEPALKKKNTTATCPQASRQKTAKKNPGIQGSLG